MHHQLLRKVLHTTWTYVWLPIGSNQLGSQHPQIRSTTTYEILLFLLTVSVFPRTTIPIPRSTYNWSKSQCCTSSLMISSYFSFSFIFLPFFSFASRNLTSLVIKCFLVFWPRRFDSWWLVFAKTSNNQMCQIIVLKSNEFLLNCNSDKRWT